MRLIYYTTTFYPCQYFFYFHVALSAARSEMRRPTYLRALTDLLREEKFIFLFFHVWFGAARSEMRFPTYLRSLTDLLREEKFISEA